MNINYQSLCDNFAVAPQLNAEQMQVLAQAGFRSVIINRPDGEGGADQPKSDDVLQAAQAAGIKAVYQPVVSGSITDADVVEFAQIVKSLPTPILAYCRSGGRCTKLYQQACEIDQEVADI